MRKFTTRALLCIFYLLCLSSSIFAQATHEITLRVNTATFDKHNPAASCEFTAGEGTVVLVSNPAQEFTIQAEVGDTIRWRGASANQSDVAVEIRKIKYERGVNLFPVDEMDGISAIEGTITKGSRGDDYKYVISFKINGSGAMYRIDPKIKVY